MKGNNINYNIKFNINKKILLFVMFFLILFASIIGLSSFSLTKASSEEIPPATKTITITKIWENDNESTRPENITVHLKKKTAKLITGENLNKKMKELSGARSPGYSTNNTNITSIQKANTLDTSKTTATVSTSDSSYPVYMWFDNGTIYFYSEAENIYLNSNSSNTFNHFKGLTDISGLAYLNTSYVTNMSYMFFHCSTLQNLVPLANWNVINVEDMSLMFSAQYTNGGSADLMKLNDLTPLSNWNVCNVTSLNRMFEYNKNTLTSLAPIANWNVRCVKSLNRTFNHTNISDGYLITGWNPSSNSYTSDGWNVKAVTTFNMIFEHSPSNNSNLHNFPLRTASDSSWSNGTYYPRSSSSITVNPTHPFTSPNSDMLVSSNSGWTKSGNTWTYSFTVNNDDSIYTSYEDEVTNYTSSALATTPITVTNNQATITNTGNIRQLTITTIWNDNNYSYRPLAIRLHLINTDTSDEQISTDNNFVQNQDGSLTYIFEVTDANNYSVWEEPIEHYTSNAIQTSPLEIQNNSATITNTINNYNVTVSNTVTGNLARLTENFEFTITLYDENNNALSGNIIIEQNNIERQILNGSTLNLKHNEQFIIKNIIPRYKYTIQETTSDYTSCYNLINSTNNSSIISQTIGNAITNQIVTENQKLSFINNKESVPDTMVNVNIIPHLILIIISIFAIILLLISKKYQY